LIMKYTAIIISIGSELLLGRTINSNLGYLGQELSPLGAPVKRGYDISDDPFEIQKALKEAWQDADLVITTGGLGPTKDDLSRQAIADFFGKELLFCEATWDYIQKMFWKRRNMEIPESNKAQAMVPEGFEVLENTQGTAPALHYSEGGKHFFALQGVPREMKHSFETHIRPLIKREYPQAEALLQKDFNTFGIGESALAEIIHEEDLPSDVSLAWLPQTGRVDLRITTTNKESFQKAEEYIKSKARKYIWGENEESPAEALLNELRKRKLTLAAVESCTGGLLQKYITDVPGSSDVFKGGIVSYANEVKERLLFIPPVVLKKHGAVSLLTASCMLDGVKRLIPVSVAVSITGIAGPDGGSKEKPVGTVFMGFEIQGKVAVEKEVFRGNRVEIRHRAAEYTILKLLEFIRKGF